jgi:predicted acetyltransferase
MGHGKGEVDGVGALLKCEVRKEQIKPMMRNFQNVVEAITFLKFEANKYHVAYPNVRHRINKLFHEVKVGDIYRTRPWDYSTMKSSRSKHQVRSLLTRDPTLC